MRQSLLYLVLVGSLSLSGCGGGGGSGSSGGSPGDDNSSDPDELTLSQSMTLNERETYEVALDSGQSLKVDEGSDAVSLSEMGGGTYQLSVLDVDRPTDVSLSVREDGEVVSKSSVSIKNTSAAAIIRKAETIVNNADAIIDMGEDRRYVMYVLDLLYLKGEITRSDKESLISEYDDRFRDWEDEARNQLDFVKTSLDDYKNGETGEYAVEADADMFEQTITEASQENQVHFNVLPDAADSFTPSLGSTSVRYSEDANTFSRFYGDSAFGRQTQDGFVFDEQYQWLRGIAQDSGMTMCNADNTASL